MKRLDLGSTYMFNESAVEDPGDLLVETCLDGSFCYNDSPMYGNPIWEAKQMISDYKQLPFADETFDEAAGGCFMEEETIEEQRRAYAEVYRVLKKGGTLLVNGCSTINKRKYFDTAIEVGFEVIRHAYISYDKDYGWIYDEGYTFRKI